METGESDEYKKFIKFPWKLDFPKIRTMGYNFSVMKRILTSTSEAILQKTGLAGLCTPVE